jgi:hypothetical protein|nr:MAG TPA: hypothetical protein [Caudoviricetes sp.]
MLKDIRGQIIVKGLSEELTKEDWKRILKDYVFRTKLERKKLFGNFMLSKSLAPCKLVEVNKPEIFIESIELNKEGFPIANIEIISGKEREFISQTIDITKEHNMGTKEELVLRYVAARDEEGNVINSTIRPITIDLEFTLDNNKPDKAVNITNRINGPIKKMLQQLTDKDLGSVGFLRLSDIQNSGMEVDIYLYQNKELINEIGCHPYYMYMIEKRLNEDEDGEIFVNKDIHILTIKKDGNLQDACYIIDEGSWEMSKDLESILWPYTREFVEGDDLEAEGDWLFKTLNERILYILGKKLKVDMRLEKYPALFDFECEEVLYIGVGQNNTFGYVREYLY